MTALCWRGLAARSALYWLVATFLLTSAASRTFAAEAIVVHLDQAQVIKLPDRATTVVIGNPLIADLSVQPGGLAVVTGRSFGATNVIVMDKGGAILTEHTVQVEGPTDQIVVMFRGAARETYSCTPYCSPRLTLGDDQIYFSGTLNEITTRNNQSMAAGSGGGR